MIDLESSSRSFSSLMKMIWTHIYRQSSPCVILAPTLRNRIKINEMGGVNPLLRLADSTNVEVQREVAACLRNLSLGEQVKVALVRAGCLKALIGFSHSGDVEVAHQACGVLANLAEVVENQSVMVEDGLLQHLKFMLSPRNCHAERSCACDCKSGCRVFAYSRNCLRARFLHWLPPLAALTSCARDMQRWALEISPLILEIKIRYCKRARLGPCAILRVSRMVTWKPKGTHAAL